MSVAMFLSFVLSSSAVENMLLINPLTQRKHKLFCSFPSHLSDYSVSFFQFFFLHFLTVSLSSFFFNYILLVFALIFFLFSLFYLTDSHIF